MANLLSSSGGAADGLTFSASGRSGAAGRSVSGALAAAFLPEGFPNSVTPDYASFVYWHAAQGLSSYIRGILSSHAVLRGVGVGNKVRVAAWVYRFALLRSPHSMHSTWLTYVRTPRHPLPQPSTLQNRDAPKTATALGAVFQFFVRDVVGMAGGIAFAAVGDFTAYSKQWRLFADVANDVGALPFLGGWVGGVVGLVVWLG